MEKCNSCVDTTDNNPSTNFPSEESKGEKTREELIAEAKALIQQDRFDRVEKCRIGIAKLLEDNNCDAQITTTIQNGVINSQLVILPKD